MPEEVPYMLQSSRLHNLETETLKNFSKPALFFKLRSHNQTSDLKCRCMFTYIFLVLAHQFVWLPGRSLCPLLCSMLSCRLLQGLRLGLWARIVACSNQGCDSCTPLLLPLLLLLLLLPDQNWRCMCILFTGLRPWSAFACHKRDWVRPHAYFTNAWRSCRTSRAHWLCLREMWASLVPDSFSHGRLRYTTKYTRNTEALIYITASYAIAFFCAVRILLHVKFTYKYGITSCNDDSMIWYDSMIRLD
jgi:hypothetical protein